MSDYEILEVRIAPKHLDANLKIEIEKRLKDQYINKLWNNIIIQDFEVTNEVSILDLNTHTVRVKVKILKSLQYYVGDIIEGKIDLTANPPIIRSEHLKMILNGITRQSDIAVTASGTKINNGSNVIAKITQIDLIIGSRFFAGTAELVEGDLKQ